MIQFNNETRQQRRHKERQQVKAQGITTQQLLNSLLWKMVKDKGGVLVVPVENMKEVPQAFALNLQVKNGMITVVAGMQKPVNKEIMNE